MELKGITLSELEVLLPAVIFGAEGDGGDDGGDGGSGDNGAGGDDDTNNDSDNDDSSNDDDKAGKEDLTGLKSALAAERKRAAAAEKRLKAAEKEKADRELAEKSELEQEQIKAQKATERAEKLASGFRRTSLDSAIKAAAEKLKFIDPTDAIEGVDRSQIEVTQDDDDPSQVEVDEDSVEKAVKKLATRKPHFLNKGTDDGEPTGGQFGRGNSKKKKTTEDTLKEKYPSLRSSTI